MGNLKTGPLQERLREWLKVRLRQKEKGQEVGALTRFAEVAGWTTTQADEYLDEKRHLSFDQVIAVMHHYDLNVHQLIDEMPLPPADFETRQMLDAWLKLPPQSHGRRAAYAALAEFARLPRPFQQTPAPQPSEIRQPEKTQRDEGTAEKKRGGGRGGR
jgi:hypothetical protein